MFVEAVYAVRMVDSRFLGTVLKLVLKIHSTLGDEFGFILWWKGEIENILCWRSCSDGLFKGRAGVLACHS